ncbi:MAG TPA: alpha/beta hydrolase [Chloroflexia bacterium]|nr:alpha/beta hydrolase [Chloroflexia bacterium]
MAVAGDNSKVQAVFAHNILDANDAESLSITRFPHWLKPYYSLLQKSMRLGAKLLPRLSLPIGFYLQDSRIFREKSLLEQFYQDPLNLTAYPLYFLASLFSADTGFLSAGKIKCPVVVISASGDTLFSRSYTQRVFQRIVAPSRQMLEFELNNHLIFNECLEEILPGLLDKLREYAQAQQETGFSI